MASTFPLWWMTPVQAVAALSAAWNCGASGQPVFLSWPMITLADIPAVYLGRQARFLLATSEAVYPKVNAVGEIPNLILTIVAFRSRGVSKAAAAKWPFLAAALACNLATTFWALFVMSPINNEVRKQTKKLEEDKTDKEAEMKYRDAVTKWRGLSIGRELLMMSAAAFGFYTVYLDGAYGLV